MNTYLLSHLFPFAMAWTAAVLPVFAGDEDLRDIVRDKRGKEIRGRVIERYHPEHIVLQIGGKYLELELDEHEIVVTVRDQLTKFMSMRKPGQGVAESWALVAKAEELGLPKMAALQAWFVLTLDRDHAGAHEYLGHPGRREVYEWPSARSNKGIDYEQFAEEIIDWKTRLRLESENWMLETDTSLERGVGLLFDLERLYLEWMSVLGPQLRASECPRAAGDSMCVRVFFERDDKAWTDILTSEREPWYSASREFSTEAGLPNLSFTWLRLGSEHPYRFFDIATQQLLYTTLILGKTRGVAPPDDGTRHAHWAELGMGYWFGSQFSGPLGHVRRTDFVMDPKVNESACAKLTASPLKSVRREVTNLIGLEFSWFYGTGDSSPVHRDKARSFFSFLMAEDPPMTKGKKVVGSGREGLIRYFADVYCTPTAHSSNKLDDALGGKVEEFQKPWQEWRQP